MGLFNRARKAAEALSRYADNTEEFPAHSPLAMRASGFGLVYEVNPVYLEAGQGGNSYFRGFGTAVLGMGLYGAWLSLYGAFLSWSSIDHGGSVIAAILLTVGAVVCTSLIVLLTIAWAGPAFFAPVDIFTRYDRKRQKVWVWHKKKPIELDWCNLTPVVRGVAASGYMPNKLYRGFYVEFGEDGRPKTTDGVPHMVQVGSVSAGAGGVVPAMEYVRRYMEEDMSTLPPVRRLLRKRPRWWGMFNFGGLADDWHDHFMGREVPGGLPWGTTIVLILMFPPFFLLQITNYLALRFAPCPKWPKKWLRMHEADLEQLRASNTPEMIKTRSR